MHHPALHRFRSRFLAFAALLVLACIFALSSPFAAPAQATTLGAGNTANNPQSNASFLPNSIGAQDAELQAATDLASGEIGTCKWVIDENGKLTISPLSGEEGTIDFYNPISSDPNTVTSEDNRPPWYQYATTITSAEILGSIQITGESCRMFENCQSLEEVDLTGLDLSAVKGISTMFYNCKKLTAVDMSMIDVSSVCSVNNLFDCCFSLASVKLPDFSNSQLTSINAMFEHCRALKSIDLSSMNTTTVHSASLMFSGCTSLEKVIVSDKWDIQTFLKSNPSWACNFDCMFKDCNALVGANGTSYAEEKPSTTTDYTFARIDTPETPGFFWPADEATGDEGEGETGNDPGTGGESGQTGEGGGTSDNPGDDSDSGQGSGNTGDNGQSGAGSSSADTHGSEGMSSGHAADSSVSSTSWPIVTLSASTFTYNGKKRTPAVTVKFDGKALKVGRDYSVTYSKGRKAIGSYNVTIIGKKPRSFKVTKSFRIIPKTPKVKSLKAQKNSNGTSGFIVKWKKVRGKSIGYQIRWSPAKTFAASATYQFKSKSPYAKKGKAALQVKNRAWLGKKAFVQVRAFKSVKGTKYYSGWSKAKRVKLKK